MPNNNDLETIKLICIINFLELQDIRRRLKIEAATDLKFDKRRELAEDDIEELNIRIEELEKALPDK